MSTFEELTRLQNELREKRNALYDEANNLQKEIDDIEIKRFNVDDLLGKYIIHKNDWSDTSYYMKVEEIKRLYKGPRLIGKLFYSLDREDPSKYATFCYVSNMIDIDGWGDARKNITVITEKEYVDAFDKLQADMQQKMVQ